MTNREVGSVLVNVSGLHPVLNVGSFVGLAEVHVELALALKSRYLLLLVAQYAQEDKS